MINIERDMNNMENALSNIAFYPVVGTVAGAVKVIVGTTQLVTAIACALLCVFPSLVVKNWSVEKRAWSHIKHGCGNVLAGIVEAVPLVSMLVYGIRIWKNASGSDDRVRVNTNHENKFMPYESLVDKDWEIGGSVDTAVTDAKNRFNQSINGRNISRREQLKAALLMFPS